tara:strand:- start:811 stop:1809 length:999 start_codon:yes stop_codon:yes gene_type:complete
MLAGCWGGTPTEEVEIGPEDRPRDEFGIPLDAGVTPEARYEVSNLIRAFRDIDPTLTSDHTDRRWWERHDRLANLKNGSVDIGNAALHAWTGTPSEAPYLVRRSLLWVGGHASPDAARELLTRIYLEYGYAPIDDRTEACLVLAETSPERFLEVTEKHLLRHGKRTETLPDEEFMVDGWVAACVELKRSPVPMLAQVATNRALDPAARWSAVKSLRDFEAEPEGLDALQLCLLESSGDGYLRRMAAQSLRDLLPGEEACALFAQVLSNESDLNVRQFLVDMMQDNCRHLDMTEFIDSDSGPAGPLPRIGGESVGADGSGIGEPGDVDGGDGR